MSSTDEEYDFSDDKKPDQSKQFLLAEKYGKLKGKYDILLGQLDEKELIIANLSAEQSCPTMTTKNKLKRCISPRHYESTPKLKVNARFYSLLKFLANSFLCNS